MKPQVGMGVTVQVGSDRYAGVIISVSESGKSFQFVRVPPETPLRDQLRQKPERARLQADGKWTYKFGRKANHYWYVTLGVAEDYRDPSF